MHMDEAKILSGPFVFVSYSHQDSNCVREDVEKLIAKGVRIWIDHREEMDNLELADDWFQKVTATIAHPNCCGVIFYVSGYALASKAIQKEQRLVLEKAEHSRFPYYTVSVDGKKISDHYSVAVSLCTQKGSAWYNEDYLAGDKIFFTQNSMISDDKLFIARKNSDACVQEIFDKIAAPLGAVDHSGSLINSLEKKQLASRETGEITFGIYKGASCDPVAQAVENSRFVLAGRHYIYHNGEFFLGRPLKWRLMYIRDAVAVLICTEVIEKQSADALSDFWKVFSSLAFTPIQARIVQCVRLMNAADEQQLDPAQTKELLELGPEQAKMYWWVDKKGALPGWMAAYKNNTPAPNGFLITRPKGIRPVIEIATTDLKNVNGG